ncbi:MAG: hypothetical protein C7B45_04890 [Sulfobacillus acidophilus]|uniref:Dipeptidylpeptidase IV N-terminal domain-containing protein n=1 Tax=Sulfobacillus acidophilus TaxID=53633 RepID=A0A2T2WL58_9FIRM|nr:MAG: hypothetical protein C7B45_04890 [Sulfobacillus acidophilus]
MGELLQPEYFKLLRESEAPQISPDGQHILYTIQFFGKAGERRLDVVYVSPNEAPRTLNVGGNTHHPSWSLDGSLIAVAATEADARKSEVHILNANADSLCERYNIDGEVYAIMWNADNTKLAVEFFEAGGDDDGPRVVKRLRYNYNGRGFIGSRRWQIALIDRESHSIQIFGDSRFHHFSPAWAPDGERLAFITTRRADWDLEWIWDVYVADLKTGAFTRVTQSDGVSLYPVWSPNGKNIAYLHNHCVSTGSTADYHLCQASIEGQSWHIKCLTHDLDRGGAMIYELPVPGGGRPVFAVDGQSIFWVVNDKGRYCLESVTGVGTSITLQRDVGWPTASRDGRFMAWLQYRPDGPPVVTLWDKSSERAVKRWDDNKWLQGLSLCREPRLFSFASDEHVVQAWLWDVDRSQSKKPLLIQSHGGPHGTFGPYFSMTQQLLASAGYCVAALNYRGSAGFGQA